MTFCLFGEQEIHSSVKTHLMILPCLSILNYNNKYMFQCKHKYLDILQHSDHLLDGFLNENITQENTDNFFSQNTKKAAKSTTYK